MGSPFIIFFPYSRILLSSHYTQNLSVTQLASCEIVLQSFPHITVFHCNNLNLASFISFSSLQSLSLARLFVTPWTAACQASLSITNSWSLFKLMSFELEMSSSHLILCRPLFLLPPIPPSIRVFSNESTLHMRWPKYWSFSFSISPSNEYSGLISFRMDYHNRHQIQNGNQSTLTWCSWE